jgi:malonyl CoA-acyl carrier protein transacylase
VTDSPTTAVLFPGQGSQTPDMRDDVERFRPDLLQLACEELGTDPFERIAEGSRFAQPAIYCASLAGWERLGRPDVAALAGHSLGEFAALVAAETLSAEDGLRLVALRGRLMDEAAERTGDGGMLAVLGNDARLAAGALAEGHGVFVANDNAPGQVVLSGAVQRLDAAAAEAKTIGLRAIRLAVAGAFHSPAMAGAAPELEAALDAVEFGPGLTPVVSCVTTEPIADPRPVLLAGLTEPVRWRETLLALHTLGVRRFVDAGPGKVLAGLVTRTLDGVTAETAAALEAARV